MLCIATSIPSPFTYDEVTNNGIAHAAAIKAADPTAEVSGPVMDYLVGLLLFEERHRERLGNRRSLLRSRGAIPSIATRTAAFRSSSTISSSSPRIEKANGTRLLDYLDLHTYFAPDNLAFSTGGDTQTQQDRV